MYIDMGVYRHQWSMTTCLNKHLYFFSDWIKKTLSDKQPNEKLGRSSCSNSISSEKTIGYEDKKTHPGMFLCFILI